MTILELFAHLTLSRKINSVSLSKNIREGKVLYPDIPQGTLPKDIFGKLPNTSSNHKRNNTDI
jgi:hypothetical protein